MFANTWQMKRAPLMTSWSENVDTQRVWSEYPRPQMVRTTWKNLNGVWDFEKGVGFGSYNPNQTFSQRILVPFPIESALSGIMDMDYENNLTMTFFYRTSFILPDNFKGKDVLLHFGAVDWECVVFVNGVNVGSHRGGYDPFTFNITAALNTNMRQEIQVHVTDPSDRGGQPKGKQTIHPGGIYYTPISGIWQTVWLEPVEKIHLSNFTIIPDVDAQSVKITMETPYKTNTTKATIKIFDEDQLISSVNNVEIGRETIINITHPKLWSPNSPFLYDVVFELSDNQRVIDTVKSYFGMRKVSRGSVNGMPCFLLNNQPTFLYGPLDQGYWPDGLYTAPCDEAMLFDIKVAKSLGMNMIRKHVKMEPARWYYHCDTMGIMVWQDMPSAQDGGTIGYKAAVQENFYRETKNCMKAYINSPCIVTWVLFNEGWGQDASFVDTHTRKGYAEALKADTTRLINVVSGWVDFEFGDFIDRHNYPTPLLYANPLKERIAVCGEYGGITLKVEDHMWKGNGQQYVAVNNTEELKNLFVSYVKMVQGLNQSGIWGAVYTQISDVEEEINGLITYDRKVVKVNPVQQTEIRKAITETINRRHIPLLEAGDVSEKAMWKYSTTFSGTGWYLDGFDDASWARGRAGFGAGDPPNTHIRTPWNSKEIYLRRAFHLGNLSLDDVRNLKIWVYHDEDCEIFINGVLAAQTTGYISNFKLIPISEKALNALRINDENLIAVKCTQSWGGQYIDVGLTAEIETNKLVSVPQLPKPALPSVSEEDSVYLMSYFKGNPQHLFYAYSENGLDWKDINYGEPVFDAFDKNIWLRDPYMKRVVKNGISTFHLVHTWGWDNPAIFHWESTDLIHWKAANGGVTNDDGKIFVMDGKNGNSLGPNAWAPEFIYDSSTELFYIFWSSNTGGYQKHHYCTTKDWLSFSPSAVLFDPGFTAIDLTILPYEGTYYGFYKDERGGQKRIRLATTKSLDPTIQAFEGSKDVLTGGYSVEVEGPEVFKAIGQNKWFLYWDKFINDQGVSYAFSSNPVTEKWYMIPDSLVTNPSQVKHGSVEIISKKELEVLFGEYNRERKDILPNALVQPQEWKYTTTMPYPGWYRASFNDSNWNTGIGGFGRGDVGKGIINTPWTNAEIYLRKKFYVGQLSDYELDNLFLNICYDDDATIYINGIMAMSIEGHSTMYVRKELNESIKESIILNGENIIAIKCIDKGGVQYIDAGLQTYTESTTQLPVVKKKCKMIFYSLDNTLEISYKEMLPSLKLRVYDMHGRVVFQGVCKEKNNLSMLNHGVYVAFLEDQEDNLIMTKRFVK